MSESQGAPMGSSNPNITFLDLLLTKLGENLLLLILLVFCFFIFYVSLLLLLYRSFLKEIFDRNNRVAEKKGVILFHEFQYSWLRGVHLNTIVVPPSKGEPPVKNVDTKEKLAA